MFRQRSLWNLLLEAGRNVDSQAFSGHRSDL
jgi:hypothetical protein